MRGKHASAGRGIAAPGITPADAGKTCIGRTAGAGAQDHPRGCGENRTAHRVQRTNRDHPRGCGENQKLPKQQVMLSGSPPRMRGKPDNPCTHSTAAGITPADAGKTPPLQAPSCIWRDHPRGCGENELIIDPSAASFGSPPRMRGKLFLALIGALPQRITPAGAGKT